MKTKYFRTSLAFISLFCFAFQGNTKETRVDSLFIIWADTTNSAAQRVEAFYQRFNPLEDESLNPEAVRWSFGIKEVQQLAREVGKEEYMGRFLLLECGVYIYVRGEKERGCLLLQNALERCLKLKDYATLAGAFNMQEICGVEDLNKLEETIKTYLPAIFEDSELLNPELIPVYYRLANIYYGVSRLPEAIQLNQKIINYFEQHNLTGLDYIWALGMAGSIQLLIGNLDEAEKYWLKRLHLAKLNKSKFDLGVSYMRLSWLHIRKPNLQNARSYLDSARMTFKYQPDCFPCEIEVKRRSAGISNLEGKYEEALKELLAIKSSYEDAPPIDYIMGSFYSELATAYLGLKQYKKAVAAAKKGIEESNDNLYGSLRSYRIIYEANTALGNYKSALEYYKKYTASINARDELRNAQKVTRQELAFQYEQKRLADSLQQEFVFQKEFSRQKTGRNILLVLGLLAALFAIGMYSRYRFVQKTKAELEEKNKIIEAEKQKAQDSEQAKHQFLANMSHEIRTPMNAIKGMTDILIRREPQVQQLTYLSAIKESSNSLLVIINDILDMSKIEAGKVELENIPFSIEEVINNVSMISQFKAEEKGLLLQTNIAEHSFTSVQGDPTRLHQVLLNLVGNAIKFTEKGVVTIQLKTEIAKNEKKVLAHFCVSDTGVGIGEDRLQQIFNSFEQAYSDTTRKFGGTGLGLSISKKLVEIQEGKIWAESSKGKGSQFYFSIPYKISQQSTEPVVIQAVADTTAASLKGVKVLLVEDNHFNAIVAKEELEDAVEDIVVETAENGVIAIEKVSHGDFDIILMDVQMPVMNGYEATKAIRHLPNGKSKTPIIAMTANVMKEEVERCYDAGMDGFIGKPFDTKVLVSKIQKLLKTSP